MSNVFAKLGVYDEAQPRQEGQPLAAVLRERVRQGLETGEKLKGTTRLREDLRQGISAYVRAEVEAGRIANREDVLAYLEKEGLTVTRATGQAITVLVPGTLDFFEGPPDEAQKHAVIRLKGGLYSRDDFDPARRAERPKRYAQPDPEREAQFSEKLERLKAMRRAYHLKRYGARGLPEPRAIDRSDPAPQIEALDNYAARVLGDDAIPASDEAIEAAPSTQRARRARAAREEEEALEQDEHHRRHL
jgi:hypothetical protein